VPAAGTSRRLRFGASGRITRRLTFSGKNRVKTGHKPSGARCRITIISTPNTITSKLPACPTICGSQSCSHCLEMLITDAPSNAPHT
jgi:hypothetical protein